MDSSVAAPLKIYLAYSTFLFPATTIEKLLLIRAKQRVRYKDLRPHQVQIKNQETNYPSEIIQSVIMNAMRIDFDTGVASLIRASCIVPHSSSTKFS